MSMTKYFETATKSIPKKSIKQCILKPSVPNLEDKVITLKAGKNTIGRCAETGIKDRTCSKRQFEVDVDQTKSRIKVKILGINPSGINGAMAFKDKEYELQRGDVIEITYGKHPYIVDFEEENGTDMQSGAEKINESWDSVENGKVLIYTSTGLQAADKIAGYDLDHTIIKTKSGNVFPKNIDDWEINLPEIPQKLKRLHSSGFKICLFTNQGGIEKGKVNVNEFKEKIRKIVKRTGVPMQVFVATADGYYRKPLPGMWELLRDYKNEGVQIDLNKSFYVGDAAGRPEIGKGSTKRRKDHSLADRLFAANIGVCFYTPEEHFLNCKTEEYVKPEFEPKSCNDVVIFNPQTAKVPSENCEMIIMVGLPGSGKSHFANEHLAPFGYNVLNADTMGGVQACLKNAEHLLGEGKSCVIDNTNVDVESRKKFIDLAQKFNVPCRCFQMDLPLSQIRHNIAYRHLTNEKHARINEMVFNAMKKRYKAPSTEENFKDVVQVSLTPKFKCPKDERLYKMYLIDK